MKTSITNMTKTGESIGQSYPGKDLNEEYKILLQLGKIFKNSATKWIKDLDTSQKKILTWLMIRLKFFNIFYFKES